MRGYLKMKYNTFYKLIDELRIEKGFAISDFCDGIISERTYLRQLKSNANFKFANFYALLKRLDIDLSSFFVFMVHYAKIDTGVNRFFIRVHSRHLNDIKPIYELIAKFQAENHYDQLIVNAYIHRYHFLNNQISREKLVEELEAILGDVDKKDYDHFIIRHVRFLLKMYDPDSDIIDVVEYAQYLFDYPSNLYLFNYILSMDNVLSYSVLHRSLALETFKKLNDKFTHFSQYIFIKDQECAFQFNHAYYHHQLGDFDKRDAYLWKSVANAVTIMGKEQLETFEHKMNVCFELDLDTFINRQLENMVKK